MPFFTKEMHHGLWLCQEGVLVDDLSTAAKENLSCKVSLASAGDKLTVSSTGIPNHDFQSGAGCCAKAQRLTFTLPLHVKLAPSVTYASKRGAIGVAVNGAELFGPEDGNSNDVVRFTHTTTSGEPRLGVCDAHSTPQGMFHYHADANCLTWHPDAGQSWTTYNFAKVSKSVSPIVAFAFDGIPIYGTYIKEGEGVREVTSSYQLKAGHDGTKGIADYEYVASLGDLDECNGRLEVTQEFPAGAYVYHSTMHNGHGDLGFPYFPLCYKGVVETSNTTPMAGMGPPPR